MGRRISDNVRRDQKITVTVNGSVISAYAGETLATIVLAEEISAFNRTRGGKPRAPYCNMGSCFECQVKITRPGSTTYRWVRACMTPAMDGMDVLTGEQLLSANASHDPD